MHSMPQNAVWSDWGFNMKLTGRTVKSSAKQKIHIYVGVGKCQQSPTHLWQLRFMWTFKQNTLRCISLTNQYDHHFSSPSFPLLLPSSLRLALAPFSSPSVWENWSAWMEWYQPKDRVIRSVPSFLLSFPPHFWHINKICGLFVSIRRSVGFEKGVWCTGLTWSCR